MDVIYTGEYPPKRDARPSIFLAGPSPRGKSELNWRPQALEYLKRKRFLGVVYVPLLRSGEWYEDHEAQFEWDLKFLEEASAIAFWIPRDLNSQPSFNSNTKFGMFAKSGKMIVGFPAETPKMRFIEFVAQREHIPLYNSLDGVLAAAIMKARELSKK